MLHLQEDKDAIRFTDGKRIHLKLLKNQIDRRILKITAMVNTLTLPTRPNTERAFCESSCQASFENINFSIARSQCSSGVLGNLNGNDVLALGKKSEKGKSGYKNQSDSYLILGDSDVKLQVNTSKQLTKLQGKTEAYHNLDDEKQTNSQHSDDNNEVSLTLMQLNLDLSNIKFDQNVSYEEQANQLKTYIRSTFSNRKMASKTDRSKPQVINPTKTQRVMAKRPLNDPPEAKIKEINRIIVSLACAQRMEGELKQATTHKRQYQIDYKARLNLLKKVEQKYKNDLI